MIRYVRHDMNLCISCRNPRSSVENTRGSTSQTRQTQHFREEIGLREEKMASLAALRRSQQSRPIFEYREFGKTIPTKIRKGRPDEQTDDDHSR